MEHIKKILAREVSEPPMNKGEPASYPEPQCPICKDAGFIHPRKEDGTIAYDQVITCHCRAGEVKKRRAALLMRYCQLPAKTEDKTFATFEIRDKKCGEAKKEAYRLARGDDAVIFLTLMSATGRGKSHLAIAICREWVKRGEPAKYAYVPELLDDIRASYRKDELTGQSYSQLLDALGTVSLLVLDDLGVEKRSEWACEKLQAIIDRRSRSALPLVVTTNKALNELPNDDEGRISNRLQRESWCKVVIF